jgi:hypothetical protein
MAEQQYPMLAEMLQFRAMKLQPTYTVGDIAKLFGVSVRAIQSRVATGQLASRDLPGRARFLPVDLEDFLHSSRRSKS